MERKARRLLREYGAGETPQALKGAHFEGALLGYRINDSKGTRVASKSIGMNYWYASDPNWGNRIARHMQNILAFDQKYYDKAAINTTVPALPGIPAGKDTFPSRYPSKSEKGFI
ncbi:hypothetical protein ACSU64_09450 [Bacillaceae bacterium C204]|uniref:hypothetical protein n=1 Tax=Neobacillus sp. 204 TaxID=3383351 RepID=UPI00397B4AE2